ncbi:MAG: type II toxin-antitoxin system ParD family antitoxin [Xenococcaceae cyanobacterium]
MKAVEKLSITLPQNMARMVRSKVASGAYASNSEVIRDALRLLEEQDALKAQKIAFLREKIERSMADEAPSIEAEEVFRRLEERSINTE